MRWMIALGLTALVGCSMEPAQQILGTLETDRIQLSLDSQEPVLSIEVVEGQQVTAGQLLLTQDPARLDASLASAAAATVVLGAQLQAAKVGPRAQEIAMARAELDAAGSTEHTSQLEWQRQQQLAPEHFSSSQDVELAQARFTAASAARQVAEAALALLLEGTRAELLRAAQGQYDQALAQQAELQLTRSRSRLTAPMAALVETVTIQIGERPVPGQAAVILLDTQRAYARVHIPEPLRASLKPGARALVSVDGFEQPFEGQLRWVARDASFTPFYALSQHDRDSLGFLAEIDVDLQGKTAAFGIPVQVLFVGPASGQ